ncbi:hypothetical protein VNO77_24282 [Canavalia gladiata]|uniref:Uncharacterized protein n=1 Tax=Canavalia gladiata TaxID=3824 RepID=A0AAN9QCC5_CANGL
MDFKLQSVIFIRRYGGSILSFWLLRRLVATTQCPAEPVQLDRKRKLPEGLTDMQISSSLAAQLIYTHQHDDLPAQLINHNTNPFPIVEDGYVLLFMHEACTQNECSLRVEELLLPIPIIFSDSFFIIGGILVLIVKLLVGNRKTAEQACPDVGHIS